MIAAGIDIGSLTAKCALMRDGKLIAYKVIKVSPNLEETAERVFQETLKAAGIGREEVERIVATGYGRNKVGFADKKVTEISCHARGGDLLHSNSENCCGHWRAGQQGDCHRERKGCRVRDERQVRCWNGKIP